MLILITYDVSTESPEGRRRLQRIAKVCCNYGQRVQNSVFECDLDATQYVYVKDKIIKTMSAEEDSIRFYNLGNNYKNKIEQYGKDGSYDPEGTLIV